MIQAFLGSNMSQTMNGAQSLVRTLVRCGVDTCFANPGASEVHVVVALGSMPEMRTVLTLSGRVAAGAADGYGRVAGKPAATLLHLGQGLADGLANLHAARRAATPIINVIGVRATYHVQYDAVRTSDILGFARPVSSWIHESMSAQTVAADAARAVRAARSAPGSIASLILPADTGWNPAERVADPLPDIRPASPGEAAIDAIAGLLGNGKKSALLLGGAALRGAGLEAAGRVQARSGARLMCDTSAPAAESGAGRVSVERMRSHGKQITTSLGGVEQLVLVGAELPVSLLPSPGKPSGFVFDGGTISVLAHPHEDVVQALTDLAVSLGAPATAPERTPLVLPELASGTLTPQAAVQAIAALTPEHAIYVDEGAPATVALLPALARARPHLYLPLSGESIGQGLPLAVGAAVAAPDRKVVCPIGDGGMAMTMQALWTMAREKLDVTTVVFANRAYAILTTELQRVGAAGAGLNVLPMFDLRRTDLNWARIGEGLGIESTRATSAEEFASQYRSAMSQRGPRLIEALVEQPMPAAAGLRSLS